LLVQFLVLVHQGYFAARSKRQKVQFGDVEIIVANVEISNDNCVGVWNAPPTKLGTRETSLTDNSSRPNDHASIEA
jgi:hypothetical protein